MFPSVVRTSLLYLSALIYLYLPNKLFVQATIEKLLDEGTRHLAAGRLSDALSLYIQAVDKDPKNYIAYYKRGTAYSALGNVRLALPDFDTSVQLNKAFSPAIKQRALLSLKTGKLKEAQLDFILLKSEFGDPEAAEKIDLARELEKRLSDAQYFYDNRLYQDALSQLDALVEVIQFSPELREMRANCYLMLGEVQKGIHEMRHGVHLLNDNREGLLKLAKLMYSSGLVVQSVEEVRECLRLDQDDQECLKHYRKVKKLAKAVTNAQDALENSKYSVCIDNALTMLKLESSNKEYEIQAKVLLCQCYARSKSAEGVVHCEEVVRRFPQNVDFQCDLAESYINADKFDEAITQCQKILGEDRRNQRAKELLSEAQAKLKRSSQNDYYAILGVSRSATKQEIASAYRDDKKKAEEEFRKLGAAKEVLTNDEMRAKFDKGVDPLDPQEQQPHFNPFGPFGGFSFANMPFGNGHFEFHFG
ncbi:hypothetical protein EG68_10732 [Paragonimus skrjabini miyazakii]|uniref:J domain-containing protein n=1 Tax=Paragonimus skrjabini miyazakii TaxID=59628 RepID=A0A8S9YEA3_9TREM|nr:hypothetical protein EG68_10732 [Paragonimus skrjabini miyazakii]